MNDEEAEKPPIELQKRPDTDYMIAVQQEREQDVAAANKKWMGAGLVILLILVILLLKLKKGAKAP